MERDVERLIVESSPSGVVLVDAAGVVQFVNAATERMLGWERSELVGHSIDVLIPLRQREAHPAQRRGFVASPSTRAMGAGRELHALRKDGSEIPVEIGLTPLRTTAGLQVLASVIDITQRKRLEAQALKLELELREGQRLESLGLMAGSIAHDFNNLLVGILGNAGVLLDEIEPSSGIRPALIEIDQAARRLAELCSQLLAYSGRGRFVLELVDVDGLVRELVDLLPMSISRRAELRFDLAVGPVRVEADATQLRQVVMNLVMNASEALGDGPGRITLSTRVLELDADALQRMHTGARLVPGTYVELDVADTGGGITPDAVPRIFDPFFTTKFTGRGLGLAAVRGIVAGHRGAICVSSDIGRGSLFRVILPATHQARACEAEFGTRNEVAEPTILVVDDEPTVRRVVRRVLEGSGHRVLEAGDGVEAVRIFRDHRDEIAAVLLDLTMPRMGGRETFAALRETGSAVPVVLTSGYAESEAVSGFADDGPIAFLQKPFTSRDVVAVVQIALGDRGER